MNYNIFFPAIPSTYVYEEISAYEIIQVAKFLPNTNSSGHDGLSSTLLKSFVDCISLPLSKIFNKSIRLGIVPQKLKIAKVVPIYKAGDKTKLINYRPISILPSLSKILERLINKRMMKFINKYNILTSS